MPPPSDDRSLFLVVLPQVFTIIQLPANHALPSFLLDLLAQPSSSSTPHFLSVTRTEDEISIVTDAPLDDRMMPHPKRPWPSRLIGVTGSSELAGVVGLDVEWRAIKVRGPMDLSLTGILHELIAPLKAAEIPVFAISTWNTDWVLVTEDNLRPAVLALYGDDWNFVITSQWADWRGGGIFRS